MEISSKQFQALDYCKNFFLDTLGETLDIGCIILYGSATYPGCFIENMSDLDILVISENATSPRLVEISKQIAAKISGMKTLKPPTVICDHIGDRIEFEIYYDDLLIDCTIMQNIIKSQDDMFTDVVRDSAELLIGAFLIWGIPIYGSIRNYIVPELEILPYYNKNIRKYRLSTITQYLSPKVARIKFMLKNNDNAVIDYFFRYRPVFLKWIFCYVRQYPVNYYKHLPMQVSWISCLSSDDKSTILLNSQDTLLENIEKFIIFYEKLLNDFCLEDD